MPGFVVITLFLGGLAAAMTGRALALGWRSRWFILAAIVLLACAIRFLHYALLQEQLLSGQAYAADFAVLFPCAWFSFSWTRRRQMQLQYPWLTPLQRASR